MFNLYSEALISSVIGNTYRLLPAITYQLAPSHSQFYSLVHVQGKVYRHFLLKKYDSLVIHLIHRRGPNNLAIIPCGPSPTM